MQYSKEAFLNLNFNLIIHKPVSYKTVFLFSNFNELIYIFLTPTKKKKFVEKIILK